MGLRDRSEQLREPRALCEFQSVARRLEKSKTASEEAVIAFDWWRWRESNSRPKTLHSQDYMLSRVIVLSSRNR